jgi:transposase InsO family protein
VNIDFITKLPATTREGYACIITIVDPLTNRVQWKAAREKDLTTEVFAREYIDMWVRHRGIPDDIISDRDKCIMSNLWGSLTAQLGIKRRHSTAYHPGTDGQAENLNAVVEGYLKA